MIDVETIAPDRPVLIAGPTASGKSALALEIAARQGGRIINADALQVYEGWRILTARPSLADEARHPHALYGHVPRDAAYSVGHWLRDVAPLLGGPRPIIVGGTGLYFAALTEGLAEIPPTPPDIRTAADALPLAALLDGVDPVTRARLDTRNRARVQRAYEVERATGRALHLWQAETAPPLLPAATAQTFVFRPDPAQLEARIRRRFDLMLDEGLLAEGAAMAPGFSPQHPSSKAIGAAELIAHLQSALSLDDLREAVVIATRQYAKRQRTWFRNRMRGWHEISLT